MGRGEITRVPSRTVRYLFPVHPVARVHLIFSRIRDIIIINFFFFSPAEISPRQRLRFTWVRGVTCLMVSPRIADYLGWCRRDFREMPAKDKRICPTHRARSIGPRENGRPATSPAPTRNARNNTTGRDEQKPNRSRNDDDNR